MSITTMGNPAMNSWKRIKMQHVAGVCGIALAVAAAVGFSALENDSKPATGRTLVSPAPVAVSAANAPRLVFYVVESETARTNLEAMIAADEMARIEANGGDASVVYHVLIADSPEAEAKAMQHIFNANGEAGAYGTFTVEHVDLRPNLAPIE
jgi:hypothetical protein